MPCHSLGESTPTYLPTYLLDEDEGDGDEEGVGPGPGPGAMRTSLAKRRNLLRFM